MNKPVSVLYVNKVNKDDIPTSRKFRVFFAPDPPQENFVVGLQFSVSSVNRQTGEVWFATDLELGPSKVTMSHYNKYSILQRIFWYFGLVYCPGCWKVFNYGGKKLKRCEPCWRKSK